MDTKDAKQRMREYLAGWEMVERLKAQAIKGMTEERAMEIVYLLGEVEDPWREDRLTSGMVEMQAILHGRKAR